ncbi:putative anion transporter [Dorcoceras hygrometricum]|uniref:Putative anion transporter n=1 Tax=Dorcoceras hygrometricum TaxID=472368 RepID=A0A2Z6ZRI6_9LAMI|nr:putative anion transporter [Dorcoceras hygrometricum]
MQIDSDLVIYRTTLLRTFQVVTICRVDKSCWGSGSAPRSGSGRTKNLENREAINTNNKTTCINIHRVFQACYLAGTCAWLQPVFQEPGASRLIAVVTSIRSTTRFETPSSDCTRSHDEISTIGFSSKN